MGQISQIYIKYDINNRGVICKGLIARYYQWNYGERMVSRARYIIEAIKYEYLKYKFLFQDKQAIEKLKRICDVNFDMRSIVMSSDIIKEIEEDFDGDTNYLFNQDNNDGQLFINVTDNGIKYCFKEYWNEGNPMSAEQYMDWDCKGDTYPDWRTSNKYGDEETVKYTEENIETINEMATLMTTEESEYFVKECKELIIKETTNNVMDWLRYLPDTPTIDRCGNYWLSNRHNVFAQIVGDSDEMWIDVKLELYDEDEDWVGDLIIQDTKDMSLESLKEAVTEIVKYYYGERC